MTANNTKTSFLKSIKGAYADYLVNMVNEKIGNCLEKLKNEKFQMSKHNFSVIGDQTHKMTISTCTGLKKAFTKDGFAGEASNMWHTDKWILCICYHNVEEIKNKIKYPETGDPYVENITVIDGCVNTEFKIEYYYGIRFRGKEFYDVAKVYFTVKADYKIDGTTVYLSDNSKLFLNEDIFNGNICVINNKMHWSGMKL